MKQETYIIILCIIQLVIFLTLLCFSSNKVSVYLNNLTMIILANIGMCSRKVLILNSV